MSKKDYLLGYVDALRVCNENLTLALKMSKPLKSLNCITAESQNQRNMKVEQEVIKMIEEVLDELEYGIK